MTKVSVFIIFSFLIVSNAFSFDLVTIQCKNWQGESVIELQYNAPQVWDGMTSVPVAPYLKDPNTFTPKPSDFLIAKSKYHANNTHLFFQATSSKQIKSVKLLESGNVFYNDAIIDLVVTFDASTNTRNVDVPVVISGVHARSPQDIYYLPAGYFQHGGITHGSIYGEPVICGLDNEGYIRRDFQL